jgi:hypothetical protein
MPKKRKKTLFSHKPKVTNVDWLRLTEVLIAENSSKPRTRGKYKGHGSTDTLAWIHQLAFICQQYIVAKNKGKTYDENMAMASLLGKVLTAWYCLVRRAKSYDPNRPLARRQANRQIHKYRGELAALLADDEVMGKVWGKNQDWNFPFGRNAKGGKFV